MEMKNSGFIASGPARPEFMNGDIYRDKYGGTYAAPRSKPISREKAWGNIQKMKTMINGFRGKK
ncbi:TPA: hypothetical protein ACIYMX_003338 [Escherichia coli]|uniref:hypothetical protein n=1 Tax=Escherichia coli TaxID=562 RepID=UPI0015819347|nr:hypothetical protein [Escherichia coli]EHL5878064.1 hypothetical protein [Escherichia coli]ELS5844743.1 hypothetical protein [Escherichia coli]EMB1318890.1 hypothetical protein [Escherichia coli]EME1584211.1 hypothetical protein [Escherichia coli]MCF2047921.1 hypothetical protein [Escherichia coli]